jgi:hypothetical protein
MLVWRLCLLARCQGILGRGQGVGGLDIHPKARACDPDQPMGPAPATLTCHPSGAG